MRYALFLLAALAMADTLPLPDESLRLAALSAIFPGMQVSVVPGMHIDDSWAANAGADQLASPDALARETVYRIVGPAANAAEKGASAQLITGKPSSTRLVRFQLFPWPNTTGLLAVLQYKFEGALPSMGCPSIALLVHLVKEKNWEVRDRYLLETTHHFSLKKIGMVDLDGSGDELVVESDFGGAETWGTNFLAFRLIDKLVPIFETTSQLAYSIEDRFTQAFDAAATADLRGEQFCFTKTTMIENGIAFQPARTSKLCYKLDEEADRKESDERNKMLGPLPKP